MSLTAEEFRAAVVPVTVAMEDAALELLLAGAWAAVTAVAGPGGSITELRDGGATYIILAFRASTITSISERVGDLTTDLDDSDWELRADHRSIRRRSDGENPSTWWAGVAEVEYEAEDGEAAQELAQLQLVKLELTTNPALAGFVVGNWSVQFQQGRTYGQLRADILGTLVTNWQVA